MKSTYRILFFTRKTRPNKDGLVTIAIISVNEMKSTYPEINLKNICLFWNMVVAGSKRELYEHYETVIGRFGIPLLKTAIPRSLRYDREQSIGGNTSVFLSTIFPPDKPLMKDSNLDLLMDEILGIINLKKKAL